MNAQRHVSYLRAFVLGLLAAVALTACVPPGPPSSRPGPEIGTLLVAGPNVFLNGRRARSGLPVFHGDRVSTGAASSARINFNGGGFVELDENTDPFWQWLQEAGRCVIEFVIRFGQVYGESDACALSMVSDTSSALIDTVFHVRVTANRVHFAVLAGRVRILSPQRRIVHSRQQALIRGGRVGVRSLSPAQFRRLTRWRRRYDFAAGGGVPPEPPRPPRPVIVPELRRRPLDAAREILAEAGLEVGRVRRDVTSRAPAGTVLDQAPPPGQRVRPGTPVDLLIAQPRDRVPPPPPPHPVIVPNVRRRPLAAAREILANAGLEVGRIRRDVTSPAPAGTVLDQTPPPGQRVRRGTPVDLVVSDRIR